VNQKELNNRNKLKEEKPLVYEKIIKNKIAPIIQLQYNYICNFKCQHCSIDKVKQKKDRRSLVPDDIKNIFEQADKLDMARVTITGGEPLAFKDLDQVVEAINPQKFYINCDSNGWLINEESAKHLKDIGIDRIQLSLDSLNKEEHDSFRQAKGSADRVLKAVDTIQNSGLGLFMQTVVTKNRLYSIEFINYLNYFNRRGVGVFVTFAKPVGAWEGCFNDLIDRKDLEYLEELEKNYNVFSHLTPAYGVNEERNCVAGRNIFSITQYGDVLPCPYFYCSMGNLFEESLETIHNRCLKIKAFNKDTCLLAEDKEFIDKYLVKKIYGKDLPVNYTNVFTEDDFNC